MSKQRWERKGMLLEGAAAGRYSHRVNVVADSSAFQCVRCQHVEKAEPCSNCGDPWFIAESVGGDAGLVCMRCHEGQSRWTCPQCGTDNRMVDSFGELKSGPCFIATAAFENVQAPEVIFLREFRDHTLTNYKLGRAFICAYERMSPPLANMVSRSLPLKRISRSVLRIIIRSLEK